MLRRTGQDAQLGSQLYPLWHSIRGYPLGAFQQIVNFDVGRSGSDNDRATREKSDCSPLVHAPVLFVADVNRALRFYVDMLGFEKHWHAGDGAGKVCQVNRVECEIILCEDARRRDKARLFIELTPEGLAELRHEIVERSVPSKESWWGYDVLQIDDPDGNELLFPVSE